MSDDLRANLRAFICSRFPAARRRKPSDDTLLLESGILDSLGVLALAQFVTDELGIELEDDDLNPKHFGSISALAVFLEEKRRCP